VTNTLHRYGKAEAFRDDYIIFAMPSKGKNDEGAIDKLRTFLSICAKHQPSNMGASGRSSYRPSTHLNPTAHWNRDAAPDFESVVTGVEKAGTAGAVFDSREKAVACLRDVIQADLGLSVNISTSVDGAKDAGRACGIERHSVEYSLGSRAVRAGWGNRRRVPVLPGKEKNLQGLSQLMARSRVYPTKWTTKLDIPTPHKQTKSRRIRSAISDHCERGLRCCWSRSCWGCALVPGFWRTTGRSIS
jgi:hypothetical protein